MNNFIFKKYVQFIERNGYFPMMFQPYNCSEITDISPTLTANCGCGTSSAAVLITNLGDEKMNKSGIIVLGNYSPSGHDASRIVDENGVAPTVKENHGTVTAVAIRESEQMNKTSYKPVCLNSKGGRNGIEGLQPSIQDRVYDSEAISTCVTTSYMPNFTHGLRIRKLTPKECWRLMGFDDEDFYKAEAVNSNTQLYKQAGNSIVVDVIVKIYEKLFERYGDVIK